MKNATPEVTDRFQDGRRRHLGNSSECYKMGNYHPILMKICTQTKKNMLSSKVTKNGNDRPHSKIAIAAMLEIQVHAMKWVITIDANWYTD
jgi:hypothetical protein